ncbi:MAG TPA: prenyltransferase/squalene oxidase repeat-containing protein [Bryobacteraceae bacterium]|nr:prenyltransferase/squalene oxidase repeat-containing protein [Bryobacteraceae bacterium]
MAEVHELQQRLLAAQNADGGWAFRAGGSSWTEPTALALLALGLSSQTADSRAVAWLVKHQNTDGGWPPSGAIPTSTWVTSLCVLALPKTQEHHERLRSATGWLTRAVNPEVSPLKQLLSRAGIPPSKAPGGSPWFPGTAGWVIPTSLSILALLRMNASVATVRQSQSYLLSHRCPDGGWNHGGSPFQRESPASYPETTGLALLSLAHTSPAELRPALRLGEFFLQQPGSLEGWSWLRMGLLAHGCRLEQSGVRPPPRSTRDISLLLLALAAGDAQNPLFLTS